MKQPSNEVTHALQLIEQALNELKSQFPNQSIFIGFSGGLDSTVLLHALSQNPNWQPQQLQAIYIHHGLQALADDWLVHCQAICKTLNVPFQAIKVVVPHDARQGVEATARKARYNAFSQVITEQNVLVTAHHQRDQAETCLLSLMRGAGPAGLASMPYLKPLKPHSHKMHVRPFLNVPYEALKHYADYHQLSWIEDPTNQQTQYKRNFIRQQILPKIAQAWPNGIKTIAHSARLQAESLCLLDDLANIDLALVDLNPLYLDYSSCLSLSELRLKNIFRVWFLHYLPIQINQMIYDWLLQNLKASSESEPRLKLKDGEVRIYHQRIYYLTDIKEEYDIFLDADSANYLQMSSIYFKEALVKLVGQKVFLRPISQDDKNRFKGLKKQFKQAKIPPWDRKRWPMLFIENQPSVPLLFNGVIG